MLTIKMESNLDLSLIEHIQVLAKSDISKEDLTDSIAYFRDTLLQFNLIYADPPKKFTNCCKEVAGKLFETFIKMLGKCILSEEVEYFLPREEEENVEREIQEETTISTCEDEYVPPAKITIRERVPFDMKLKIITTANEHPQWSFKYLQKRFKLYLRHNSELARFRNDVLTGGTFQNKMDIIKKKFMIDLPRHRIASN